MALCLATVRCCALLRRHDVLLHLDHAAAGLHQRRGREIQADGVVGNDILLLRHTRSHHLFHFAFLRAQDARTFARVRGLPPRHRRLYHQEENWNYFSKSNFLFKQKKYFELAGFCCYSLQVIPIVATVVTLLMLEVTSFFYFVQFTGKEAASSAWPAGVSFMFMYMWKELPINMFMCLLLHLMFRFQEIRDKLKEVN